MTIWLIKETYWRDGYNGDFLEEVYDTDLGYFTSQDAAGASGQEYADLPRVRGVSLVWLVNILPGGD
jgi:hypothetical protein